MDNLGELAPLLILFVLLLFSRQNYRRALAEMSPELRDKVYSDLGRYQLLQYGLVALLMILVFLLDRPVFQQYRLYWNIGGAIFTLLWFAQGEFFLRRKAVEIGFPPAFVKASALNRLVLTGMLLFLFYQGIRF